MAHVHEWELVGAGGSGGGEGPTSSSMNYTCYCGAVLKEIVTEPGIDNFRRRWEDRELVDRRKK